MFHRETKKLNHSVRLFPRLATTNRTNRMSGRRVKIAGRTNNGAPNTDPIASVRAEVKARLLKMILDNEQVRRNARRPNQA